MRLLPCQALCVQLCAPVYCSPYLPFPDMFIIDDNSIHNEYAISSAFNNHFKSVFTRDNGCFPHFQLDLPFIPDAVSKHGNFNLLKIDVKKSPGPDNISNTFLKHYADWSSMYLRVFHRKLLEASMLPHDYRTSRIKRLHKSG